MGSTGFISCLILSWGIGVEIDEKFDVDGKSCFGCLLVMLETGVEVRFIIGLLVMPFTLLLIPAPELVDEVIGGVPAMFNEHTEFGVLVSLEESGVLVPVGGCVC